MSLLGCQSCNHCRQSREGSATFGLRTGGDSDAPWGTWCSAAITGFDSNHTPPRNIGSENHPIYHFAAAKPKAYIIYLPPSNGESNTQPRALSFDRSKTELRALSFVRATSFRSADLDF